MIINIIEEKIMRLEMNAREEKQLFNANIHDLKRIYSFLTEEKKQSIITQVIFMQLLKRLEDNN